MKTSRSNPLRSDPSRTGSIRRKFESAIKGRFSAFREKLIDLIVGENAFGITANARFQFHTDAQKLEEFRKWLGQNTDYILMGSSTKQIEENFWEQYIQEAYKQGQGRAFDDLNKPYARGYSQDNSTKDFYSGTKHQFLQQSFGQPETKEKIQLLAGRTFSELKGMTDAMIPVLSRNLVDGLARGDNPRTIAAQLEKSLGISESRALAISRTECLPGDTLVTTAMVRAVFRRWYVGDMIEIVTSNGRKFSATPNHPMLTKDGWINAGCLKQGDQLISDDRQESSVISGDEDIDRRPISLSQIFDSLSAVGTPERRISSVPDFHGDGMGDNSEVDVFSTDRVLRVGNFASIGKPLAENVFSEAGFMSSRFCPKCSRLLSINEQPCLCDSSEGNSGFSKPVFDCVSISPKLLSKSDSRLTSQVPSCNLIDVQVGSQLVSNPTPLPRIDSTLREVPRSPCCSENSSNGLLIGIDSFGDLPLSQTTQVKFDDVVLVTVRPFAGHVFNLETPYGYYTIEGYYTGNTLRAHSEGALDAMEKMGVEEVGVMVEWSSADDSRVCPLCRPLDGVVLKISEARGMFPRHTNCRCTPVPAGVGESSTKQKKSQTQIDTAIDESIEAEIPKKAKDRTVAEQKDLSKWQGADAKISQDRPRSVLDGPIKGISQPTPLPIAVDAPASASVIAPQRVVEAKAINAFDRPNVDKALPLVEKLKSPELDAIRQYYLKIYEEGQQAPVLSKQIADAFSEQHLLGNQLEDLDKRRKELGTKEYKKLYKQFEEEQKKLMEKTKQLQLDYVEAKKKQVMKFQDIVGIRSKDDRAKVEPRSSAPITTTDLNSNTIMTEVQSKKHKFKADQAAETLSILTGKRDKVDLLPVTMHQSPVGTRAFSQGYKGIFLSEQADVKIFVHELGHQLEGFIPEAKALVNEFRKMRIERSGTPDENLKKLFPDSRYGPDETGNKDDWEKVFGTSAYYVGKSYPNGSTEVISMGLEQMMEDPALFAKKDPEYFNLVIGILRGVL